MCITGSIDTTRGDLEGYNGFNNALLSARQHHLEHEILTGDQVNERFPGYKLPSNFKVSLYHRPVLTCSMCISGSTETTRGHLDGYSASTMRCCHLETQHLTGEQVNERFRGHNLPSSFKVSLVARAVLTCSMCSSAVMSALTRQGMLVAADAMHACQHSCALLRKSRLLCCQFYPSPSHRGCLIQPKAFMAAVARCWMK